MGYRVIQDVRGKPYAYWAESHWDKEKKQSRQRRKYLGAWDEENQRVIPKKSQRNITKVRTFGPAYLLREVCGEIDLPGTLESSLGEDGRKVLALALARIIDPTSLRNVHHILEDNHLLESLELEDSFDSQWMSRFLDRLSDNADGINRFYHQLIGDSDSSSLIYDITSLSSTSRNIEFLEYGHNEEGRKIPQVNLGLVMSTKRKIPVYHKIFPGSVNDVVTLKNLVAEVKAFGVEDALFILDRGFYSESNIVEMTENGIDFVIPLPFRLRIAKDLLSGTNRRIAGPEHGGRFGKRVYHVIEEEIPIGGITAHGCLLLNEVARGEEAESFYNRLMDLEMALNGKTVRGDPYRHSDIVLGKFKRYFNVHMEERTIFLTRRKNAISQAVNRFGKVILIASKRMEWDEMLSIYKEREGIERQYRCLKTELEAMPMRVRKMSSLEGPLFIFFVSMIVRSLLLRRAREAGLLEKRSVEDILLELRKLRIVRIGAEWNLSEITKNQREILEAMRIPMPH